MFDVEPTKDIFLNLKSIERDVVERPSISVARMNFYLDGSRKTTTRAVYNLSELL